MSLFVCEDVLVKDVGRCWSSISAAGDVVVHSFPNFKGFACVGFRISLIITENALKIIQHVFRSAGDVASDCPYYSIVGGE